MGIAKADNAIKNRGWANCMSKDKKNPGKEAGIFTVYNRVIRIN